MSLRDDLFGRISHSLEGVSNLIRHSRLSLDLDLRFGFKESTHSSLLLANEWHFFKLFLPFFGDGNSILFGCFSGDSVPLRIGIIYGLLHLLGM